MNAKPQLTDVQTLRVRARRHIEEGAVTEGYRGDRTEVLKLLNEALATELVCVLQAAAPARLIEGGLPTDATVNEFLFDDAYSWPPAAGE